MFLILSVNGIIVLKHIWWDVKRSKRGDNLYWLELVFFGDDFHFVWKYFLENNFQFCNDEWKMPCQDNTLP